MLGIIVDGRSKLAMADLRGDRRGVWVRAGADADPVVWLSVAWAWGRGDAGRSDPLGRGMSEKRKDRTFTPEQKAEIVLAGLRGDRSVRDVCREYEIAETLYYQWLGRLLEGGKAALATSRDRGKDARDDELRDAKKQIAQLERALGKKTYEVEVAGELLREWA